MISAVLTHAAVLVNSLERAVSRVKALGLETNPFEEFEHEGTRECYVGTPEKSARLLLLEAIKNGPYKRAFEKRGPGLHHFGVWIPNLEEYADQLGSTGWLMHSKSLVTVRKLKTAYFVRPGTPYIVEAYENVAPVGPPSIEHLLISAVDLATKTRTDALGISNMVVEIKNSPMSFLVEGRQISLGDLIL